MAAAFQLDIHGKARVSEADDLRRSIARLEGRIEQEKRRLAELEGGAAAPAAAGGKAAAGKVDPTKKQKAGKAEPKVNKDEDAKFVLTGAKQGEVVTRFPPEASGYMHIGHAKAALTNYMLAEKYGGRMVFRFDDTNPAKEDEDFERSILEDTKRLGIKFEKVTYTSDRFDEMFKFCEQMLNEGTAYVDTTDKETIREQRMNGVASKCRGQSKEENLALWADMKAGKLTDAVVRAKMSVDDPNKCLRDPALYRSVLESHCRTGEKYKVYPTYDFACPIVDSLDGVTHALRTSEYNDRNPQYHWICDALKLRKPHIEDFSRLNMEFTVMSKRKLTKFVNEGAVDGWDDPRMPTVKGILRRGLTLEALRRFIVSQGMSRANNFQEWGLLWNINRNVVDPDEGSTCRRYVCVAKDASVRVALADSPALEVREKPWHKKNPELGKRPFRCCGPAVLVEEEDMVLVKDTEEVTLMDWGNIIFQSVDRADEGKRITAAAAKVNPNGDFRKTQKLTWIADVEENKVPVRLVEYDHIITKTKVDPDDDVDSLVNRDSKIVTEAYGEEACKDIKKGDIVQFERRGYYICDEVNPLTMIYIPDGRAKRNHLSAYARRDRLAGKAEQPKKAGGKDERGMTLEERIAKKKAQKSKSKEAK